MLFTNLYLLIEAVFLAIVGGGDQAHFAARLAAKYAERPVFEIEAVTTFELTAHADVLRLRAPATNDVPNVLSPSAARRPHEVLLFVKAA